MAGKIVVVEDVRKPRNCITKRELEIVTAIAQGKKSKEIAEEMGLSFKTIEVHRHNVLKRLGCRHTSHLIAVLFREEVLF